jgi:ATP-binding cassette, subfamily B (MDR/TAP), member 1
MDNQSSGDIAADSDAIEENEEGQKRFDTERNSVSTVLKENEKLESSGSSSGPVSDKGNVKNYDSTIVKIRDVPEGDAAFAHLPEHERAILKKQVNTPTVSVTWLKLYRYSTFWDKAIVCVAAFCAIGSGTVMPLMTVGLP